jgi:hypothetical protein
LSPWPRLSYDYNYSEYGSPESRSNRLYSFPVWVIVDLRSWKEFGKLNRRGSSCLQSIVKRVLYLHLPSSFLDACCYHCSSVQNGHRWPFVYPHARTCSLFSLRAFMPCVMFSLSCPTLDICMTISKSGTLCYFLNRQTDTVRRFEI